MQDFWITSDLHFGHKNILKFCPETRPYPDLDAMQVAIVKDWNSKVKDGDLVFDLGDFSFHKSWEYTLSIVEQLNGQIIKIKGNHDNYQDWHKITKNSKGKIAKFCDYYELKYHKRKIVMSHFPFVIWNGSHYGSLHAHGHTHGSYQHPGRAIDVGWDAQGSVIRIDDFIDMAEQRDKYTPSHHKGI